MSSRSSSWCSLARVAGRQWLISACLGLFCLQPSFAQTTQSNQSKSEADVQAEVGELRDRLATTQQKLDDAQSQIQELRSELQEIKARLGAAPPTSSSAEPAGAYPTLQNAINESKPEAEDLEPVKVEEDEE